MAEYRSVFVEWWSMLFAWICSLMIWWRYADRRRLIELVAYGLLCSYLMLDALGAEFGAWVYQYKVLPVFNRLIPVDVGVLPVIYMMTYQVIKRWKPFVAWHIVIAFLLAFIVEPLVLRSGVYIHYYWNHVASFPFL